MIAARTFCASRYAANSHSMCSRVSSKARLNAKRLTILGFKKMQVYSVPIIGSRSMIQFVYSAIGPVSKYSIAIAADLVELWKWLVEGAAKLDRVAFAQGSGRMSFPHCFREID